MTPKDNLCKCGCGKLTKQWKDGRFSEYMRGHNIRGRVLSDKTKQKISKSNTGYTPTLKTLEKLRLSHTGLKQSKFTIEKRAKKLRGKKRTIEQRENISNSHKGLKYSLSTRIRHSLRQTGEKIFTGFKTQKNTLIRNSPEYRNWRNGVFKRDNYTCQNPNCSHCNNERGVYLHSHHIKSFVLYPELRFYVDNGLTLCKEYHIKSDKYRGRNLNIQQSLDTI